MAYKNVKCSDLHEMLPWFIFGSQSKVGSELEEQMSEGFTLREPNWKSNCSATINKVVKSGEIIVSISVLTL